MDRRWSDADRSTTDQRPQRERIAVSQEVQVHVAATCNEVMVYLSERFHELGIRVYQSFDLQTALERLPQCGCPHHGEEVCSCQYAIWLLYGPGQSPVLMILHGRDEDTWITLAAEGVRQTRVYGIVMQMASSSFAN